MELFTGRSPTPRRRVDRTRSFCRLPETKVTATGKVYQRGGTKAIVIDKIESSSSPEIEFMGHVGDLAVQDFPGGLGVYVTRKILEMGDSG